MTVTTDNGLEWAEGQLIGADQGKIDAMAVGSGSTTESTSDTSLDNRVSDIITDNNNPVRFLRTDQGFECFITIQGGSEVPSDTEIREVGVYSKATVTGESPILVARDVFSTVTVNPGHSVEFQIPIDLRR